MSNPKDFYRTYQADDGWSELSNTLVAGIQSLSPAHALEFGCGTGKHLSRLNDAGICTVGIDISPINIYKAIHKYGLPCVINSDETYLRHLCNIDVCFTVSVLDHIEQADGIVLELQRIANKAVFLAETVDVPRGAEYYYPHKYEVYGFVKLDFEWLSPADGARYNIWRWNKQ